MAVYCDLHDYYFSNDEQRDQHVQDSRSHPHCKVCDLGFLNYDRLRNHYIHAESHYFCPRCHLLFHTSSGLRVHQEENHPEDDLYSFNISEFRKKKVEWAYGEDEDKYDAHQKKDIPEKVRYKHFDVYMYADLDDVLPPWSDALPDLEHQENDFANETDEDDDGSFACPCCDEETEDIGCTPCNHVCCLSCIKAFHDRCKSCPVCGKRDIKLHRVRKIYVSAT